MITKANESYQTGDGLVFRKVQKAQKARPFLRAFFSPGHRATPSRALFMSWISSTIPPALAVTFRVRQTAFPSVTVMFTWPSTGRGQTTGDGALY